MSKIGDNLKKFREARGLKQTDIAKAVNKSGVAVSNWEHGLNKPNADEITILCGLLDVDANTLLGWDGKEHMTEDADKEAEIIVTDPKIKKIMPDLMKMSNDDIELLESLIKKIQSK